MLRKLDDLAELFVFPAIGGTLFDGLVVFISLISGSSVTVLCTSLFCSLSSYMINELIFYFHLLFHKKMMTFLFFSFTDIQTHTRDTIATVTDSEKCNKL